MSDALLKSARGIVLRSDSGALTAGETAVPRLGLDGYRRATVHIQNLANLATPDADDKVDFLIDTAYDGPRQQYVDTTLNVAVAMTADRGDKTLELSGGPAPVLLGDEIRVGNEQMFVEAISGTTLTVERAIKGTALEAHAVNDDVFRNAVDWVNVAYLRYGTGQNGSAPAAVIVVGGTAIVPGGVTGVQGDITAPADNSIAVRALPLGERLRLRTQVAGATAPTYRYEATADFDN